jgi:tetratricopeptide (TPR) repeat protein
MGVEFLGARRIEEAAIFLARVIEVARAEPSRTARRRILVEALSARAAVARERGQFGDAVASFHEVVDVYEAAPDEEIAPSAAFALHACGHLLSELAGIDKPTMRSALAERERLERLFSRSQNPAIRRIVAESYYNSGDILAGIERVDEAVAAFGLAADVADAFEDAAERGRFERLSRLRQARFAMLRLPPAVSDPT